MEKIHPLKSIIKEHKKNPHVGIYSACTSNKFVIEAAMERALKDDDYVLIEATVNQVNQFGGYTGMRPADFKELVFSIARKVNFPDDKIILGGDHLGPLPWRNMHSDKAMDNAKELIREFILSGFSKIHIDTSMHLGDDDLNSRLAPEVIAERGAALVRISEESFSMIESGIQTKIQSVKSVHSSQLIQPVYVIGSEVPIPGGGYIEDKIHVTESSDFKETVKAFKDAFDAYDLQSTWENVVAVVVQPGVEFGRDSLHEYNRETTENLCNALRKYPGLVFEAHSTDYQSRFTLKEMVEDGFAILKVGPALTFALREALFALNHIEKEMFENYNCDKQSKFIEVLDAEMLKKPEFWEKHYYGSEHELKLARKYSLFDRCRYYLPVKEVQESIERMIYNLKSVNIPLTLISQYMPLQYKKIREGLLKNDPEELLKDSVVNCIENYLYATKNAMNNKS